MSSTLESIPEHLKVHIQNIAKAKCFSENDYKVQLDKMENGGFMTATSKISIIGNRNVNGIITYDKLSLICKLMPSSQYQRTYFGVELLFKREVYIYNNVLPVIIAFQKENNLTEETGFFAFPNCYIALYDAIDPNKSAIIMDDLQTSGFCTWDSHKEISFDAVKQVMIVLGRLHGISFAIRDQKPHIFQEFHMPDLLLNTCKNRIFREMFEATFYLALETLEDEEDLAIIRNIKDNWLTWWSECLSMNVAEPFSVIGHGDCWNNNFMFRCENVSVFFFFFLNCQKLLMFLKPFCRILQRTYAC